MLIKYNNLNLIAMNVCVYNNKFVTYTGILFYTTYSSDKENECHNTDK